MSIGGEFEEKSERVLNLLEHPPRQRGKVSKRLGGNIGCRDKNTLMGLKRFPNGSSIESTVQDRGRNPLLYCTLRLIAMQRNKNKTKVHLRYNDLITLGNPFNTM